MLLVTEVDPKVVEPELEHVERRDPAREVLVLLQVPATRAGARALVTRREEPVVQDRRREVLELLERRVDALLELREVLHRRRNGGGGGCGGRGGRRGVGVGRGSRRPEVAREVEADVVHRVLVRVRHVGRLCREQALLDRRRRSRRRGSGRRAARAAPCTRRRRPEARRERRQLAEHVGVALDARDRLARAADVRCGRARDGLDDLVAADDLADGEDGHVDAGSLARRGGVAVGPGRGVAGEEAGGRGDDGRKVGRVGRGGRRGLLGEEGGEAARRARGRRWRGSGRAGRASEGNREVRDGRDEHVGRVGRARRRCGEWCDAS